jgi:hypothetical protein
MATICQLMHRNIFKLHLAHGHDPHSGITVKTPLDAHVTYSKTDCPETIDTTLRAKVWQAHGKLINLAV